jgi:hypothetical protein
MEFNGTPSLPFVVKRQAVDVPLVSTFQISAFQRLPFADFVPVNSQAPFLLANLRFAVQRQSSLPLPPARRPTSTAFQHEGNEADEDRPVSARATALKALRYLDYLL